MRWEPIQPQLVHVTVIM